MERRKEDIDLIWKHTPDYFRGNIAKDRRIMYDNRVTMFGAIAAMPTDLYENCLRLAKIKQQKLEDNETE